MSDYPYNERGELVRAVLRYVATLVEEEPHAHSDAEAEYAEEWLEAAVLTYAGKLAKYKLAEAQR
jgi:hypothetical protein